jgi:NADPH:quinone reductase-like Zn-dependent oxidoreductase
MRAFVVTGYKEPLQRADVPEPVVGEHDVLVRVVHGKAVIAGTN